MSGSSFDDDEIKQEFRRSASKKKNVGYNLLAKKRELLACARTDTPEEFRSRLPALGVDPGSPKEAELMRLFLTLTRFHGPSR